MGMSIYYQVFRDQPLSWEEQASIRELVLQHSVESDIAEYHRTGKGPNWQSFHIYDPTDPTEPGVVFEGATGLPDNSAESCWTGVQHWSKLLTAIRRLLPAGRWEVRIDDHEVMWDDGQCEFDPSK
jgi:hypothetical protein